jgi:anti-sigma factor RsiW
MNKMYKELLMRALDGELSPNESRLLEDELTRNPELVDEKEALEHLQGQLAAFNPSFSDDFDEKLMQRLSLGAVLFVPNHAFRIFKRVGMVAAAAIFVLLTLVYWHEQSLDINSLLGISDLKPEDFDNLFANY